MNKVFYNVEPGAELRALQDERRDRHPHFHTCPKCGKVEECERFFCRRMEEGYIDRETGQIHQPVPFICHVCLPGPKINSAVHYVSFKRGGSRRSSLSIKSPRTKGRKRHVQVVTKAAA